MNHHGNLSEGNTAQKRGPAEILYYLIKKFLGEFMKERNVEIWEYSYFRFILVIFLSGVLHTKHFRVYDSHPTAECTNVNRYS